MKQEEIKKLLEKYWNAETSRDEEDRLKQYCSEHPTDPTIEDFVHLNSFYQIERKIEYVHAPKAKRLSNVRVWTIAASLLIICGLSMWMILDRNTSPYSNRDFSHLEISDPDEALSITLEALSFASVKLNNTEKETRKDLAVLTKMPFK